MTYSFFPVIDPVATGENIVRLRKCRGLSVRDLQEYFGFEEPQAIYKWQRGKSLPSVDNLYALGAILNVPMDEIIVPMHKTIKFEQQAEACCSSHLYPSYRVNCFIILRLLQRPLNLNKQISTKCIFAFWEVRIWNDVIYER